MLKRNIGRSLLALLVITGLAGTIDTNALSGKERKQSIAVMRSVRDDLQQIIQAATPSQLAFKSNEQQVSIQERFTLLINTEQRLWSFFEKANKQRINPELRATIRLSDEEVIAFAEQGSSLFESDEFKKIVAANHLSIEQGMKEFKRSKTNCIRYMRASTADLRNRVIQLPFGSVDAYQLYLLIGAYGQYTVNEINKIKMDPAFPAK